MRFLVTSYELQVYDCYPFFYFNHTNLQNILLQRYKFFLNFIMYSNITYALSPYVKQFKNK